jgi:single-strand DNA-binding protein
LKQRSWETPQGEKRTVFEVDVEEVGPALRSVTAKVARVERGSGDGGFGGGGGQRGGGGYSGGGGDRGGFGGADPWANSGAAGEEPPF